MPNKPWLFQRGNPGGPGRPKGYKRMAWVDLFDEEKPLKKIALNPENKNQFEAIKLIVHYKYGQPTQNIDATIESGEDNADAWEAARQFTKLVEEREGTGVVEDFNRAISGESNAGVHPKRRSRKSDKNNRKK